MSSIDGDARGVHGHVPPARGGLCIVAGGAGFIGSHLCERLLAQGHRILCLDSLITGRLENIAPLLAHPRFRFLRADVTDLPPIEGPVGRIYNLACAASPGKYQIDPVHTLRSSVIGAINLLELARREGARILQASTSEVYGDPKVSPQAEDYAGSVNCWGPRACYDEGKRAAETLFHDYAARHGVEVRIARIFNTYGPRMAPDDGRVVSNFISQALRGGALTIYGDGRQTRAFCHVADMVDGLIRLMEADLPATAPVNLGNPAEIPVGDLARLVLALTGAMREATPGGAARVVHLPLPVDDPRQRCPDIGRARAWLGWSPRIDLTTGLRDTITHFADELARGMADRSSLVAAAS